MGKTPLCLCWQAGRGQAQVHTVEQLGSSTQAELLFASASQLKVCTAGITALASLANSLAVLHTEFSSH